jgi:hypothetical protein
MNGKRARKIRKLAINLYNDKMQRAGVTLLQYYRQLKTEYNNTLRRG